MLWTGCLTVWLVVAAITLATTVDFQPFDKAVRENPKDAMAYYKRATAYLSANKDVQALSDLATCLSISPNFEPALYYRARTNLRLGFSETAKKDASLSRVQRCQEIVTLAGEYDDYAAIAREEHAAEEWDDCVLAASKALKIAPKSVKMHRERFECYMARGDAAAALADLADVVTLDKSDSEAVSLLARAEFYFNDQRDKALQLLRRCVSYDPDSQTCIKASKELRKLEKQLKQPPLKINYKELTKVIRKEAAALGVPPDEVDNSALLDNLRHARCVAFADAGRWVNGANVCAKVRDSDPDFLPAILVQAHMEKDAKNYHGALQLITPLIHHGVDDPRIHELYHQIQDEMRPRGTPNTSQKDLYKILGVDKKASAREIKKAYRELSKKYHPDKYRGKDLNEDQVMAKMQEINEAYEILSDDDKRQEYDLGDQPQGFRGGPGPGPGAAGHGGAGGVPPQFMQQFARQFGAQGGFKFNF